MQDTEKKNKEGWKKFNLSSSKSSNPLVHTGN
jgi:hypothetical protein